jgi:hypothetical protein
MNFVKGNSKESIVKADLFKSQTKYVVLPEHIVMYINVSIVSVQLESLQN